MFSNHWLLFGAGVVVGVLGARFLLSNPVGRKVTKDVVKQGFVVRDWMVSQVEMLHEDISDLVAEARLEHERATDDASPVDISDAMAEPS